MSGKSLKRILMIAAIAVLPLASLQVAAAQEAPQSAEELAQKTAEQAMPRTAIPFKAADFDKFVGTYELNPETLIAVSRNGEQFLMTINASENLELLAESSTKFFMKRGPVQISFDVNAQGKVSQAVLHQGGREMPAMKVTESVAKTAIAALNKRIQDNKADPARASILQRYVPAVAKGQPTYELLTPRLAASIRDHMPQFQQVFARTGPFKSLEFKNVGPTGLDVYTATYENEQMEWTVGPLNRDGKEDAIVFRRLP